MTQLLSPKGAQPCKFSAHACCGQMAGWMKMTLDTEVGFVPGDIVLDGDPAPPLQKGGGTAAPHQFSANILWPNGSMDQDATWYGSRPRPWPYCIRWEPSSPSEKDTVAPSFRRFRPMSIMSKRSPISATAEHLFFQKHQPSLAQDSALPHF